MQPRLTTAAEFLPLYCRFLPYRAAMMAGNQPKADRGRERDGGGSFVGVMGVDVVSVVRADNGPDGGTR